MKEDIRDYYFCIHEFPIWIMSPVLVKEEEESMDHE